MSNVREPRKINSIEKKNRIIDAGLKAFGDKGYHSVTTVDIAKIAGVSTGIVYSYFKDKKDILLQALRLYFERTFAPMKELLSRLRPPIDPESTVRQMIEVTVQSHRDNLIAHEEMVAMSHIDEDVHRIFMEEEHKITDAIAGFLREASYRLPRLEERTHLAYNLMETLCHEYVYHRHDYIDYRTMTDLTVQLVIALFNEER